MIILALDPGTRLTGYAVIKIDGSTIIPLDYGCIRPPPEELLSTKYQIIYESTSAIAKKFSIDEVAIETPFGHPKNPQSFFKLGMCVGVCIIAVKVREDVKIFGYTPRQVKLAVTGTGTASKQQMQETVTRWLQLKTLITPQDAADAVGIALCHAQFQGPMKTLIQKEL